MGCRGALILALVLTSPASAEPYVAALLRSVHIGNDTLKDTTPGLTLGWRYLLGAGREAHLEGGVFRNSYGEASPLILGGASARLMALGDGELRLGASLGTARHRELAGDLKDRYGIPNAGGFVPVPVATLSFRQGRIETRLSAVPPDSDTLAVFNLSVALGF